MHLFDENAVKKKNKNYNLNGQNGHPLVRYVEEFLDLPSSPLEKTHVQELDYHLYVFLSPEKDSTSVHQLCSLAGWF